MPLNARDHIEGPTRPHDEAPTSEVSVIRGRPNSVTATLQFGVRPVDR